MGALAYLFIVPILILTALVGFPLALSRFHFWANIPGGILVFFTWFETRSGHGDSSLQHIAPTTNLLAILTGLLAVAIACLAARRVAPWQARAFPDASQSMALRITCSLTFQLVLAAAIFWSIWLTFTLLK